MKCILASLTIVTVLSIAVLAEVNSNNHSFGESKQLSVTELAEYNKTKQFAKENPYHKTLNDPLLTFKD